MFPRWFAVLVALFGILMLQPGYALAGGRVVAWGNSSSTNVPPELTNVVAIAANASGGQCLALNTDGTAVSWGYNVAAVPFGLSNLVAVAVGNEHMLALRDDGTVVAWGGNRRGQTNVPPDLTNVTAIAAASDLSLALKADGSVVAWGIQTNVPSRVSQIIAISAGSAENLALKDDATLISWSGPTITTGSIGAVMCNLLAVTTGSSHNLALLRDGTMRGWGASLEATNIPADLSKVVAISAGRRSSVALKTDGTVVSWGELDKAPAWMTNVTAIAAGYKFCLALIGDNPTFTLRPFSRTRYVGSTVQMDALGIGTAPLFYQWYWNNIPLLGETNTSLVLTNLDYAQGGNYSVSVSNAVGMNVSPGATLTVISSPPVILASPVNQHLFGGESAKFEVTAIGNEPLSYQWHFGDAVIAGATNPVLVVDRLVLRHAGQYMVMVSNALGIALSSPAELKFEPMAFWTDTGLWPTAKIPPLTNVAKVSAGGQMFAAHSGDDRVVVWGHGSGSYGMTVSNWLATFTNMAQTLVNGIGALALLGDGTVATYDDYIYRNTNCVPGLTNIVAITAGYLNNLALSDQGKLYAWGRNYGGETNVPSTLTNAVGIASGDACNWAVAADGHVVAWGTNNYGQLRVPIDLENAIALAAGQYHCLALREDGTVTAWGDNRAGQTNVPPGLSNVIAIAAGWQHSFALRADGTLVGWGGSNAQAAVAAQLDNVISISARGSYSAAMLGDGKPVLSPSAPRRTRFTGQPVVFNAQALGEPPLFYQWQFNGLDLPGATNAELVLTNAAFEHAGSFRVTVSNRFGIAIGEPVQLALRESPPTLRYEPVSQTVFGGEWARFQVVADGSGPLAYQWQYE